MATTDTNAEVIDGTAVEIYRQPPSTPSTLFHTDDPVEVIEKATRVADALKKVVASRGLIARIGGKEHPQVEAWQTLGSMVGVFPVRPRIRQEQWPNPVPDALKKQHDKGLAFGFTASFDAQRADGAVVGGAEASCMRTEKRWADADDYAVKSMAQTRATSKTLATPLRFIMTLAGYEGTPAEEMPSDGYQARQGPPPEPERPPLHEESAKLVLEAIGRAKMGTDWVRSHLVALGVQNVPEGPLMKSTILGMTPEQAVEMVKVCDKAAEAKAASQ